MHLKGVFIYPKWKSFHQFKLSKLSDFEPASCRFSVRRTGERQDVDVGHPSTALNPHIILTLEFCSYHEMIHQREGLRLSFWLYVPFFFINKVIHVPTNRNLPHFYLICDIFNSLAYNSYNMSVLTCKLVELYSISCWVCVEWRESER